MLTSVILKEGNIHVSLQYETANMGALLARWMEYGVGNNIPNSDPNNCIYIEAQLQSPDHSELWKTGSRVAATLRWSRTKNHLCHRLDYYDQ